MFLLDKILDDKNKLCEDIPIYSFGLFPFFPRSSIQVKPLMLKIFKKYFLILGLELIPMLSGLLSCLLPGLEEQDYDIQHDIMNLLNDIKGEVGEKFFIRSIWFILLKNSKNRLSALKILTENHENASDSLIKCKIEENDSELLKELKKEIIGYKSQENSNSLFFNNSYMIFNALSECIEDEDIIIKKNCLDFLIKTINLQDQSKPYDKNHMIRFSVSLMKLLNENDLSIIKRIFDLLFKTSMIKNYEIQEEHQEIIENLVLAFQNILNQNP